MTHQPARLVKIDLGPLADRAETMAAAGGFDSLSDLVEAALEAFAAERPSGGEPFEAWLDRRVAEDEEAGSDIPLDEAIAAVKRELEGHPGRNAA